MIQLKQYIRNIPDFPKQGINFKDITPLLKNPVALKVAVQQLTSQFKNRNITAVAGIEARGFIFGSLIAWELGVSFIPLRKLGKLPAEIKQIDYALEYGFSTLEVHADALTITDKVLLVDDLLATGGTAQASCELIESLDATIVACAFIIELDDLNGKKLLENHEIYSLLHY